MGELEEEYDYQREIEPDEHTRNENINRSRYFFAMISFLIALLILGIYLNNYYDLLSGWLLLAGVFAFGAIGVFFLLSNNILTHIISTKRDYQSNEVENTFIEAEKEESMKEGYTLLGLYEGVPLTTYGQARVPHPEIITIYERTIVDYCYGDPDRIRRQVRHTVLHEVAHHFGIDHEEMPIWIR